MADRGNAEVLQILDCQAADHVEVDMVLAESRLVFSEPELPQPARDIHARLPDRAHAPGATEIILWTFIKPKTRVRQG